MTESRPTPPWAKEMPEGSFISYGPTYKVGEYFYRFKSDKAANMKYYFFDPTEYDFEKGKKYPLMIFLHGYTNALEGDVCINYAGAEFFSSPEYQEKLGGAYILVPLANEERNSEDKVINSWSDDYISPLKEVIDHFINEHAKANGDISKKLLWGNSGGASMTVKMGTAFPDFFDVLIPVGCDDIPSEETIKAWTDHNLQLLYSIGKRDEFNDYYGNVVPAIPLLKKLPGFTLFDPDWVYNGDKGIASLNFGVEMGQHCLVNPMHSNLIFDDGTDMDPRMPGGLLNWINKAFKA